VDADRTLKENLGPNSKLANQLFRPIMCLLYARIEQFRNADVAGREHIDYVICSVI
jgi:hypothetical protein